MGTPVYSSMREAMPSVDQAGTAESGIGLHKKSYVGIVLHQRGNLQQIVGGLTEMLHGHVIFIVDRFCSL